MQVTTYSKNRKGVYTILEKRREEALRKYKLFADLLESKGMKPADVCRETHIDASTFTRWKQGEYTPKVDKLVLIAKELGVDVSYFF